MFIESAFYKMPELLLNETSRNLYEDSVRNILSLSLLLEFNVRNISSPMERIKLEKGYTNVKKKKLKCDLYVDLQGIYADTRHGHFGFNEMNWIEIKYFGGIGRSKGSETKTENVGKILNDILRLCICPEELPGKLRANGRYFVCVFNDHPKKYLPKFEKDSWLTKLFKSGKNTVKIDFKTIQDSARKSIKFLVPNNLFKIKLSVDTKSFYPLVERKNLNFYGFLTKIIGFEIQTEKLKLKYNDFMDKQWDKEKIELSKTILQTLLSLRVKPDL